MEKHPQPIEIRRFDLTVWFGDCEAAELRPLARSLFETFRVPLLKVELQDFAEADEIFTVLMGDQVEPRRDFIERNALQVANLDV